MLVSDTFLSAAHKHVGDELQLLINRQSVRAKIVASVALFPTHVPKPGGPHLVVANLDRLLSQANRLPGTAPGHANEVWLPNVHAAPISAPELRARGLVLDEVVDRRALRDAQQRDPLVAAAWEGVFFISFGAVLLLTALGVTIYAYLSARARAAEFALLRTLGMSRRQLAGLVTLEYGTAAGAGVIAGTVLGPPLGRLMLGYMGITATGEKVLPPMSTEVSWGALVIGNGVLVLLLIVTVTAVVRVYTHLALHQTLRVGEP